MSSSTFYAIVLSAAASLIGLLFFAVLFNVDRRGHKLGARWLALARSTLNMYVVLLLFPFAALLPDLDDRNRAVIVLALAAYSVVRQFALWGAAWKMKCNPSKHVALRIAWLLLVPVSAYVVIAYTAAIVLWRNANFRHDWASQALLALFIAALRNSWNLVLEHAGLTPESEVAKARVAHMG